MILWIRRHTIFGGLHLEDGVNHQVLRLIDSLKLLAQIVSVNRIIIRIVKFLNESSVGSALLLSDFFCEFFVVEGAPLVSAESYYLVSHILWLIYSWLLFKCISGKVLGTAGSINRCLC